MRIENGSHCCFVPMRINSVLDELRSSLFEFIQDSTSKKVLGSTISSEVVEFEGLKEMYNWVSYAWR